MLKRIKLNNSTAFLIGIILIVVGIAFGFLELFGERKEKVFSDMNILLYKNEIPNNIESDDELKNEQNKENDTTDTDIDQNPQTDIQQTDRYNYIGVLEIPKINLKRGFLDLNSRYNKVNYNITVIKGSTFPNESNNNLILAAHSGRCSICFFDKLFNLSIGDIASLTYNNKKYNYSLVKTYEVEKDGTVPIHRDYNKGVLTLITCTKNSNTKQTVFVFELV